MAAPDFSRHMPSLDGQASRCMEATRQEASMVTTSISDQQRLLDLEEEDYFFGSRREEDYDFESEVSPETYHSQPDAQAASTFGTGLADDEIDAEMWETTSKASTADMSQPPLQEMPQAAAEPEDGDQVDEPPLQAEPQAATTMMIRNIACKYSPQDVRGMIDELGFADSYDFFYLPMNRVGRANKGYCFVNFHSPEVAAQCQERMTGIKLGKTSKLLEVSPASVQGLENLVLHFDKKVVSKGVNRPVFL